jgi:hypothetical protein
MKQASVSSTDQGGGKRRTGKAQGPGRSTTSTTSFIVIPPGLLAVADEVIE